jgi:hypothetical protein
MSSAPSPGLCGDCVHARRLPTGGGSEVFQCLKSRTDARLRKWPVLPVLSCPGYEPGEGEEAA